MKHESVPKISALKISHEFPFKILKMNHFNFTKKVKIFNLKKLFYVISTLRDNTMKL